MSAEAIRRRPGMYVGEYRDGSGMHHMLHEAITLAVAEHRAGHASYVRITFDGDHASVEDDGRGIPLDPHPHDGRSTLEVALTVVSPGGGPYSHQNTLFSVGLPPICALSSRFEAEVWRDGQSYLQRFARGVPLGDVETFGPTSRTGTCLSFTPDSSIVARVPWDLALVEGWARDLAALNPRLTMIVEHDAYRSPDGLVDLASTEVPQARRARHRRARARHARQSTARPRSNGGPQSRGRAGCREGHCQRDRRPSRERSGFPRLAPDSSAVVIELRIARLSHPHAPARRCRR